jgi:hypothetical protein
MFGPEQQTSTDRRPRNAGPAPPPYRACSCGHGAPVSLAPLAAPF